MPKYLHHVSYTTEGLKELLKDGGSKRQAAIAELAKSAGGRLEASSFAFGESDLYFIIEAPDSTSAAAVALVANAAGAARLKTTVLLAPEEIDQATRKSVTYHQHRQE